MTSTAAIDYNAELEALVKLAIADAIKDGCKTPAHIRAYINHKGINHWCCIAAYFGMRSGFWDVYDDDKAEEMLKAVA